MLIALDNKNNRVAINDSLENEKYYCQFCGEELCRKLGAIRCHHFSHKANSHCTDSKWHDMSEWHINWQNEFPTDCQEILKIDSNGKKHIADVLLNEKTVIEFQHSNLPYEIFNDRNEFYNKFGYKVIWIFDGNKFLNDGNIGIRTHYHNPLKPLSMQKGIPSYLNIYVEGNIINNSFDEEDGKFLFHISDLSSIVISFNGKIRPEEFINAVNNDEELFFGTSDDFMEEQIVESNKIKSQTLLEIIKEHPKANKLIAYNTKTGYDVLIDRYNMNRGLEGKFIMGKMKLHKIYGDYLNKSLGEIYYIKDPVWIFQEEYK